MTSSAKPLIGRGGMNAVTWLLMALAVVSVVLAVAIPLQQLTETGAAVPVTLTGEAAGRVDEALPIPRVPEGATVTYSAEEYELSAAQLPAELRLLSQAATSLLFLSVAGGAWCLALVLRSIRAGQPFDRRNPGRLTGLAVAIVGGGLLAPIVGNVAANAVLGHLDLLGPDSPFVMVIADLKFNPLLFAAIVMAFAEAFRRGGALDDDVEGLV
jgi:hypothetical protein